MAAAGYEYVPFEEMLGGEVKIYEGKFTICRQVRRRNLFSTSCKKFHSDVYTILVTNFSFAWVQCILLCMIWPLIWRGWWLPAPLLKCTFVFWREEKRNHFFYLLLSLLRTTTVTYCIKNILDSHARPEKTIPAHIGPGMHQNLNESTLEKFPKVQTHTHSLSLVN